jgi:hypothetical protein
LNKILDHPIFMRHDTKINRQETAMDLHPSPPAGATPARQEKARRAAA